MGQRVEQTAPFARQPVVAALVDLNESGFPELAKPLRKPVFADAQPAGEIAEGLGRTAQLPDERQCMAPREQIDEAL
jgi:hypothetical protein